MIDSKFLIRLEEELAFQEQKLEGLHGALLGQQRQIDKLEVRLETLEEQLKGALHALHEAAHGGRGVSDEKPPHYL